MGVLQESATAEEDGLLDPSRPEGSEACAAGEGVAQRGPEAADAAGAPAEPPAQAPEQAPEPLRAPKRVAAPEDAAAAEALKVLISTFKIKTPLVASLHLKITGLDCFHGRWQHAC